MKRDTMVKEMLYQNLNNSINLTGFKIHLIHVADGNKKGGWSRQIGAKEGMLNRSLERWHDHWNMKKKDTHLARAIFRRWDNKEKELYLREKERLANEKSIDIANDEYPEYETIVHDSVWDFFDFIKYNHKNKNVSNTDTLIFTQKKKVNNDNI